MVLILLSMSQDILFSTVQHQLDLLTLSLYLYYTTQELNSGNKAKDLLCEAPVSYVNSTKKNKIFLDINRRLDLD